MQHRKLFRTCFSVQAARPVPALARRSRASLTGLGLAILLVSLFCQEALADTTNCVPLPEGLISWWAAEGNAADAVNVNHGSSTNGPVFGPGIAGQAFSFGNDRYVFIPNAPCLNPAAGLTIEAWVCPTLPPGSGMTIISKDDGYSDRQYLLSLVTSLQGAPVFRAHIKTAQSGFAILNGTNEVALNTWTHVACTYDGSVLKLYVNGVLDSSRTALGAPVPTTQPLFIGRGAIGFPFCGLIDEPSLYSRSLSLAEIQAIYLAGSFGKCSAPTPPVIFLGPTNQTAVLGRTVGLTVGAGGTAPLSYQWLHEGTNLPGATTASLGLTNIPLEAAGNYAVRVTNAYGTASSSNAVLTVATFPPCAGPADGLVSWWRAEGTGSDHADSNHGALSNGVTFVGGMVGQAFSFNGNQYVQIPDSPSLNPPEGITLEAWVFPATTPGGGMSVIQKDDQFSARQFLLNLVTSASGQFVFRAHVNLQNGGFVVLDGTTPVETNTWTHVAMTYDGFYLRLYVNGVIDTSKAAASVLGTTSQPVVIGGTGSYGWRGRIDEVALYRRGLCAAEIQAIYAAGSDGKCADKAAFFQTHPTNQIVNEEATVVLSALVGGTPPLSCQWFFNGAIVPGATHSSLCLSNVQSSHAGVYAIVTSNRFGSAISSNAVLTVISPPACAPTPAGLVSWWSAEDNAADLIGRNDGALSGNTAFGPGRVGQGFVFDGEGDAVKVGNPPSLRLQSFTIEAWVKRGSASVTSRSGPLGFIFSYGNSGYGFAIDNSGGLMLTKVGVNSVSSPSLVTDTNFHHVAVTKSGSTVIFYTDGVAGFTGAYDQDFEFSSNASIGGLGHSEEDCFLGTIDDLTIYNRPLSASELQAIYNAGRSGKCFAQIPPFMLAQPTNQVVFAGNKASFRALAAGPLPLAYQWSVNDTVIEGATNATLTLTDVQPSQAGDYHVLVSNAFGTILSSNATLTVEMPPPCIESRAGLVSWWRLESDGMDSVGTNHAALNNAPVPVSGQVGDALNFDGSGQYAEVPDAPSLNPAQLSVEAWVYLAQFNGGPVAIVSKDDEGAGRQYLLNMVSASSHPVFRAHIGVPGNFAVLTGTRPVPVGSWTHVAMTYDGTALKLYVNGILDGSLPVSGPAIVTTLPLRIGRGASTYYFTGRIDEVSFYARGLSAEEVLAIYKAGVAGKCRTPVAPFVLVQPASYTNTLGADVTFSLSAVGSLPLAYQWYFQGQILPGTSASSLSLSNVQYSQAGQYSVVVSNAGGSITSSYAGLTVLPPPAKLTLQSTSIMAGVDVWVPLLLTTSGKENALSLSLGFDPNNLAYAAATPGSGAAGAGLLVNTNQLASGNLGLSLAMPPNVTFPMGTQEVIRVKFHTLPQTGALNSAIEISDDPYPRRLLDTSEFPLPATFFGGLLALAPTEYEGDVSPRPGGNQTVMSTDWMLLGQYAARLTSPTNAAEFQRADCAPIATGGDGAITVTDWVQVGRYASGLDQWRPVSGPGIESPGTPMGPSSTRLVTVGNTSLLPGQARSISVTLASQGNENALGFSLSFDPTRAVFTGAVAGGDASGATLFVNSSQTGSGRLGIALALPSGSTLTAGSRELVRLTFQARSTGSGSFWPAFSDVPVVREVSDPAAAALPVSFAGGPVVSNEAPVLRIMQLAQTITLAWPLWATNFLLQEADGALPPTGSWSNVLTQPVLSNEERVLSLLWTNKAKFYRLHQP